jgi:hypothetical protein
VKNVQLSGAAIMTMGLSSSSAGFMADYNLKMCIATTNWTD